MVHFKTNNIFPGLIGVLMCLIILLPINNLSAQQETPENDNQTTEQGIGKEELFTLIANEVVLAPGVGLRNILLGEQLSAVQNRLGPATQVEQEGVFNQTNTLLYRLDSGTTVLLRGRNLLGEISVRGSSADLVRTVQGARFGMNRRLIQQIYRTPSKSRQDRLEYAHFGVTFFFDADGVNRIDLYPRKT